jgi:hypothetical protein
MPENNVQIELELVTRAFDAALREATKSVEGFGKEFETAEKDASKSLGNVGKAGKDAGKDVEDGAKKASGAWETFKGVLGAEAVVGAFGYIKDAATALFNTFVVDGVKGALEAEASLKKLQTALAIAGDGSEATLVSFQKFANQMQKNTTADGDVVLSQLAVAKAYGLSNDQAKTVVKTAYDMAAALGIDADTAVKQLSESFTGQAGRLSKLNPAIGELTKSQLEAGAAAELLGAQFAGSAAGKVDTFEGKITQTKITFGDLQEEIGAVITQNPALLAAIAQAGDLFREATAYVAANSAELKGLVAEGVQAFISAIQTAVSLGQSFNAFVTDNSTLLQALAIGVGAATIAYGAYALAVNGAAIASEIATIAQTAFNVALTANPVGIVIVAVGALAAGVYLLAQNWDAAKATMAGFAAFAVSSVQPAVQGILDVLAPLVGIFDEELGESIDQARIKLLDTTEELLQVQADLESKVLAQKQTGLDQQTNAEAVANAIKLAAQQQTNTTELAAEQGQSQAKLANLTAELTAKATAEKAAEKEKKDREKKVNDDKAKAEREFQSKLESDRKAARAEYEKNEKQSLENQRLAQARHDEERYNAQQSLSGAIIADTRNRNSFEMATDREKVANFQSTLGQISSLQNSSSKELFEVGKAAAIAQATINTYQAATVALASAPPPFGFALAAAVTVAGLLNVKNIASQQAPRSGGNFADGGFVPGASFSGDRVQANVNSGELILNRQQQQRLFQMANGDSGGGSGLAAKIDALANAIFGQPIVVEIDGEAIATAVRSQVRGGFALGGT